MGVGAGRGHVIDIVATSVVDKQTCVSRCIWYEQKGEGTHVFRVPRAEAATDVRVLRELRELWGLDELLLHVRPAHLRPVEVAAVRERVQLRMGGRLGRRARSNSRI